MLSPSIKAEPGKGKGGYANTRLPTPSTTTEAIKKQVVGIGMAMAEVEYIPARDHTREN